MRQTFIIIITLFITTTVYSQSLEERIAVRACECLGKAEEPNEEKRNECISNAMLYVLLNDADQEDKDIILGALTGNQNIINKVDSIISLTYERYTLRELREKKKKYYTESENRVAHTSFIIGNELMDENDYNAAIESYKLALQQDSTNVPVLDNIAFCYKRLGDFANALKYYQKSLEIYPEGEIALVNTGVFYTEMFEFEISNQFYLRTRQLYPDNPEGYFGLARNYILLGDFEKGLENISIAHDIYQKTNAAYRKDAEAIITIVYQEMKKNGRENEFHELAKKYNIKTDYIDK